MKAPIPAALAAEVVSRTLDRLPGDLRPLAQSVPVHFEEAPAEDLRADDVDPDTLGLFTGDALGEESDNPLPPQIVLYLANLWDFAEGDPEVFRDEVRLTYLHELGHFFGWDEEQVARRGLE